MLMNKLNQYLNQTDHDDIDHAIAKYMKRHIEQLPNMTIDEVAGGCYVSKAKITKFTKALGYDNFIALKEDCDKENKEKKVVLKSWQEHLQKQYLAHLHDSFQSMEDALAHVDILAVQELVDDIQKSQYIFLYGVDYGRFLSIYFQYSSDYLNKDVIIIDESFQRSYEMKDNSLLIVLSANKHPFDNNPRIMRILNHYPVKKWLFGTDDIEQKYIDQFDHSVILPVKNLEFKDKQVALRYLIDALLGRFLYLYREDIS